MSWDDRIDLGRKKKVKSKKDDGLAHGEETFSGAVNAFSKKAMEKQEERKGGGRMY